jgi:Flp pilus assembly pilin Flp
MSELAIRIHAWVSNSIASLRDDERGQDLIEYAMFGGLIAGTLVTLGVLAAYSGAITAMANGISNCVDFNGATVCDPF